MQKKSQTAERITISLPHDTFSEVEAISAELHISKSELFNQAFIIFLNEYNKKKLSQIARMMKDEYAKNKELNSLKLLDGEDFR